MQHSINQGPRRAHTKDPEVLPLLQAWGNG